MAGKHSFPPGAASKGGRAVAAKYGGWHGAHLAQAARRQGLPVGAPAAAGPRGSPTLRSAAARPSVGSVLGALRSRSGSFPANAGQAKVQNVTHRGSPARTTPRTTPTPHAPQPRTPRVGGTRRQAR